MLAVLDLGKLVQLLKESGSLDAESHGLGASSAREALNNLLEPWKNLSAMKASGMAAPLLLAWATFLCLTNSMDSSGICSVKAWS